MTVDDHLLPHYRNVWLLKNADIFPGTNGGENNLEINSDAEVYLGTLGIIADDPGVEEDNHYIDFPTGDSITRNDYVVIVSNAVIDGKNVTIGEKWRSLIDNPSSSQNWVKSLGCLPPENIIQSDRSPRLDDLDYPLGQEWSEGDRLWKLVAIEDFGTKTESSGNSQNNSGGQIKWLPTNTTDKYWQTFTPPSNNGLQRLLLKFGAGSGRTHDLEIELREGIGPEGKILASKIFPIVKTNSKQEEFQLVFDRIPLYGGKKYTYTLRRTTRTFAAYNLLILYRTASDPLPKETNDGNHNSYPFRVIFEPTKAAKWIDLSLLPSEEQVEATNQT